LRTLRLPNTLGFADIQKSQGVAGYKPGDNDSYLHLGSDAAELVLSATESTSPRLDSANARIERFEQSSTGAQWQLKGHVPLEFAVAHADSCRVRVAGRDLTPVRRTGKLSYFELKTHAAGPIETYCRP
jgi:polysaccharide biosynthesis protein PelA